jgi:hypothetical protein
MVMVITRGEENKVKYVKSTVLLWLGIKLWPKTPPQTAK